MRMKSIKKDRGTSQLSTSHSPPPSPAPRTADTAAERPDPRSDHPAAAPSLPRETGAGRSPDFDRRTGRRGSRRKVDRPNILQGDFGNCLIYIKNKPGIFDN